ncbi:hypothetical protein TNCT_467371 [Trichonephila clavata]|uniref:C2H2-type domain-containing protein n=1 Tax=Trichonephila clavata TaxID=2740835 RepID=A0A8X6GYB2_TRICU|nr:hypothetical protein TNCT_467371 [Trichonephila clavata]
MSKESDKIRNLRHSDGKVSEPSTNLNIEEVENLHSTSNPKLSEENHPRLEAVKEKKSKRDKTLVDEAEENNQFDCNKCGERFKDFESVIAHDCPHKETKIPSKLKSIFDLLHEKELPEHEADTSVNENISVSLTFKISNVSCKTSKDDSPPISECQSESNKTYVDKAEESKNKFDCKRCGVRFKSLKKMITHYCTQRQNKNALIKVSDLLQEMNYEKNNTYACEAKENIYKYKCKSCGERFKSFEGKITHDCTYGVLEKVAEQLQKMKSPELPTETSIKKNISVGLTSKISSPPSKISKNDFPESMSPTTCKKLSSTKTPKADSSRSRINLFASDKLQSSRRSLPSTTTKHTERKATKIVYNRYPIYVTPPRLIPPSQTLKDGSLSARDSATKNLFPTRKRSCSPTENRSLQTECIKKDSVQSLTLVTPKERSSSPPDLFKGEPSRILSRLDASYNLQSSRRSCTAITRRPPEIEVVGRVYTKYPALGTPPRSISLSHTQKDDSSGSVMDPVPINLFQSHQMYNTEMFSDPSGSVRIPTAITLDQSPRIFSSETSTDSSGSKVIPAAVNLVQSPEIYDTETITDSSANRMIPGTVITYSPSQLPRYYNVETLSDSSGSVMNPTSLIVETSCKYTTKSIPCSSGRILKPPPVDIFQSPYLYDATVKTISPQTDLKKYDSLISSTFANPKPAYSSFKMLSKDFSRSFITTAVDSSYQSSQGCNISPKEKFPQTERKSFVNIPAFETWTKSSPSSDDSSIFFNFSGASLRSQSQSPNSSEEEISPRKKWNKKNYAKYISFHKPIKPSSLKPFSKDSIESKESVKVNLSQLPMCSSISAEKLTPEIESGESKPLSSETSKQLSPSFTACIKDSSGSFVNPETKGASESPQCPKISDEKRSPQAKESAKEIYAKSLPFPTPKKGSPRRSRGNTPAKIKKQERRSISN